MSKLYVQIGQRIRELRQTHTNGPVSQEALAAKLGRPANTVSRWETGTYKSTAEDLDNLSRFFGVPITVFFPEIEQDSTPSAMLTSALRGLQPQDLEEVLRYAQFRKARTALEKKGKK